ncbi:TM7S3/TM198-like domain-containing protein [Luteitalea sp.]
MLPETLHVPAAVLFLVGGVLSCFLGQRTFRIVLGLYGFVVGVLVAGSLIGPADTTRDLLMLIGGGVGGAVALVLAYFIGVALIGAAFAALAVHAVAAQFGSGPPAMLVIACTIAGALIALSVQRYVIVVGTAFGGAWLLVMGALGLWHRESVTGLGTAASGWQAYPLRPAPGESWVLILWLLLAVAGLVAQLRLSAPRMARAR